jgi:hypothetical protein
MKDSHPPIVLLCSPLLTLVLLGVGAAHAQPPLYRIGAPYPPLRDPRLTTDNGIPGTGYYYYRDYPYPSLREALQTYGLFGRRFRTSSTIRESDVKGRPPLGMTAEPRCPMSN